MPMKYFAFLVVALMARAAFAEDQPTPPCKDPQSCALQVMAEHLFRAEMTIIRLEAEARVSKPAPKADSKE